MYYVNAFYYPVHVMMGVCMREGEGVQRLENIGSRVMRLQTTIGHRLVIPICKFGELKNSISKK